ncbi:uridine diphosphate glucose pyrophosphatase NUDT22 [Girardinichthys multiradiatus]|uniref:uridine diphosphate glucose pyrophosphatase NUDT22 n=1 Tax=Girardinichthys multiradiatus TaxID=208333 RepID=UPI001FAD9EDE|nr:uridine diphosphate glucose pyrophosphatase NUDT22 [Girardinichthys multiradiatus]XP_047208859.1 uridine diphosphate glucose pyrophosphatase NUDT22 [Girardinichthys multiradiatus]
MVDPEVSILLHCAHWRGLLENHVQVELSDRFNRQTDPFLEQHINKVWTERLSKEPWLFNGAKFRLHSFCLVSPEHHRCFRPDRAEQLGDHRGGGEAAQDCVDIINGCIVQTADGGGVNQKVLSHFSPTCSCSKSQLAPAERHPSSLLTLRLGLTCYKDYLGTNWSCQVAELCQRGQEEFGDPLALLAQPLGVGAVLCTRDGQVVFIRRSQKVAEAAGMLDIPGGHPEPKAVCEHLGEGAAEEHISVVMMQQRPDAIVSELFSSVCAEIRDEVNIPLSSLGAPVLMGVALNHTSAGRPSAEFYVSCSLSSDEVRKLYWKGGAEANESTDAVFLCRTEVLQLNRSSPLWSEMCPSAKGAVLLYQMVKPEGKPSK